MKTRQMSDGEREIWNEMQRDAWCEDDFKILRDQKNITARKAHNCANCAYGGINPGEQYDLLVVINEGRFEILRFCKHMDFQEGRCRREQAALDAMYESEQRAMREAEEAAEDLYNWHISGDLPEDGE